MLESRLIQVWITILILHLSLNHSWINFQNHVWDLSHIDSPLKYVWITLESHRSTLYRAITLKTLEHNNRVSTSSNSLLGSESLSITIESLLVKFQFRVIPPSSRLNHFELRLHLMNYIWVTLLPLSITFESASSHIVQSLNLSKNFETKSVYM